MLAIRLQRHGRAGYPTYRLVIQEAQKHPLSGRVVAFVGTYNPHTKEANIQTELVQKYLDNGARPTPRVVKLIKAAGVKLPKWVVEADDSRAKSVRKPEKLRRNRPAEEPATAIEANEPEVSEASTDAESIESVEQPTPAPEDTATPETVTEESVTDASSQTN